MMTYQLHENLLKLDNIKNYKYFMQYLKVMRTEIDLELVGYNFIIFSFILQMSWNFILIKQDHITRKTLIEKGNAIHDS